MGKTIRRAAVLGAGVMGSGIAAHLANAGIPVLLLDMVPPNPSPTDNTTSAAFRNRFALSALAALKKQKPAPLFSASALGLITPGNFDDHLERIRECDWVVEVVKEDMAIKRALFGRIEPLLKADAIVSSNTSGLSVDGMTEGRTPAFQKRFLVTHFFNPVRYMKLLELVPGRSTDPKVLADFATFGEEVLGKGIVYAKDTTNFVANRIGTYAMMRILWTLQEDGLSIEEVDKIFGPAMGRPKSAVFRTADLVGLDTLMHVAKNCFDTLTSDESRQSFAPPAFVSELVKRGALGEKSGAGFYKKSRGEGGEKEILVLDLKTFEYRPQAKVRYESLGAAKDIEDLPERLRTMLKGADKAAKYAQKVTLDTLAYASRRIPEIADDYVNVDRAMRWGFGWDLGPFEVWDALGVAAGLEQMKALGLRPAPWVEAMVQSGRTRFYEPQGIEDSYYSVSTQKPALVPRNARCISVDQLKRGKKVLEENGSASLYDAGDGIALLEFHSKLNSIDDQITEMMERAIDTAEEKFRGLVIGNDGAQFSAGANLMAILFAINNGELELVKNMVRRFQMVNQRLRYSGIPVVTAPFGLTLGGGAEVAMAGNAIQAASELYMGLVEVGVGLIPGGGGNLQMLRNVFGLHAGNRDFDPFPFIKKIFLTVGTAKVATSAEEARESCFLTVQDGISMSREHLLADAKARCIGMAEAHFRPPRPSTFSLPGKSGAATVDMLLYDMQLNHQISEHDRKIGRVLASVITGGDVAPGTVVTEQHILDLELEAFLSLCGEQKTQERMMYMLEKGKPLRN